jgi:hypothetical protein
MYYSDPDQHFEDKYMEIMGLYSTILTQVELDPSHENAKPCDKSEIASYYTAMSHVYFDDEFILTELQPLLEELETHEDDVTEDEDHFISVLIGRIEEADKEHTRVLNIRAKKREKNNEDERSRNQRS